jgi:hypothetical protein
MGAAGAGVTEASITHTATYGASGRPSSPTQTVTGVSVGTASADRLVVAAFGTSGGPANSSATATIAGNSATKIVESVGGDSTIMSIFSYGLASGTSATFAVTYNTSSITWITLNVWAIYDANHTATDSFGSYADIGTGTIDIEAGGCALGGAVAVATGGATHVWAGLTEEMDAVVSGYPTLSYSSASDAFEDEQSGRTVSVTKTHAGANAWEAMSVVSFGPA